MALSKYMLDALASTSSQSIILFINSLSTNYDELLYLI